MSSRMSCGEMLGFSLKEYLMKIREKFEKFCLLMVLLGVPLFFLMLAATRNL
jgi:hypothetical protein